MTKFVTYYNLCPIHDPKEFLGIAADREKGCIITTLNRNIIVIIKASTQKQIRSWSVLEKLSTKVVFDGRSNKYVGVFAGRALRCWDVTTTDVNKCRKLKFHKSIAELISTDEDTLVLYSDGTCEYLADAIQSRKEEGTTELTHKLELSSPHILSDGKVLVLSDGRSILTYFEKNKTTGELDLIMSSSLPLKSGQERRFKLRRHNLNVRVAGYAVIEGHYAPLLLTIWSDKRIFLLNLNDDISVEKSPGNFVSMFSALSVDTSLSVLGISKHFVAIYGANSGQEGASLLLYNTQFKVVKAKQFFKVYFDFSRLWAVDDNILLAMGQNLSIVTYRVSKELLADLVGTQVNNEYNSFIEGDHINEEDSLQESLKYMSSPPQNVNNAESVTHNTIEETSEMHQIQEADGKEIPFEDKSSFERKLASIEQLFMHVEVKEENERVLEDINIDFQSNCNNDDFSTREVQLIARQLENLGSSEYEISEKLLTVLMKSNLLQDIAVCLRRYTNVSEKMLAKTLSYVLDQYTSEQSENDFKENKNPANISNGDNLTEFATTNDFAVDDSENFKLLNVILSCSFDSEAMAMYIRHELDFPKVLCLLGHLYRVLTSKQTTFDERPNSDPLCVQLEMKAFRWFGVVLNAHFQQLALSKNVQLMEILFKWHELFTHYKQEAIELEQLAALLYSMVQRKKIFKGKNYSKWYTIEELTLY